MDPAGRFSQISTSRIWLLRADRPTFAMADYKVFGAYPGSQAPDFKCEATMPDGYEFFGFRQLAV